MKKLLYLLLLSPVLIWGQTTTENYIKTSIYRDSTTTSNVSLAKVNVTYYDGLGRPKQKVSGKASALGKDLIIPIKYDNFGRMVNEYLPYAASTDNLAIDLADSTNVVNFYNTTAFENTTNPYSQKFFEPSPLNRLRKQSAPGSEWLGSSTDDSDHTVKLGYQTNTATEVKKLTATAGTLTNGAYPISFVSSGNYAAGSLYKTITKDENIPSALYFGTSIAWKMGTTEEFKDKEGRVVLKRTYNSNYVLGGTITFDTLDTYYVYEQYGNLTYVLPPIAAGVFNADTCYQYIYDSRNRLVEKRLPGRQWEYIVYDSQDRVVASGPALTPFGGTDQGWNIIRYDAFGRVAYTGWVGVAAGTTFTSALRKAKQDETVAIVTKIATPASVDGFQVNYSAFPSGIRLLTVNYYDNYTFPGGPTSFTAVQSQAVNSGPKGLATGNWVRVLDAATAVGETSYTLYDMKGRPVRTRTANYLGGYTQTDSKLDFDGSTVLTLTTHKRSSASTDLVVTTQENFTYDIQDRVISHTHTINGGTPQLMAYNNYNEIGQLTKKKVGGEDISGTAGLQHVDYSYNIRGWLKGINNIGNLASTTGSQDLFAFKINYTGDIAEDITGQVVPLYNGNIAETSWRTAADNIQRRYGYTYDKLNRLRDAWYQMPQATVPVRGSYNEHLKYDLNGNITSLQRYGDSDSETLTNQIDNLTYTYHATKKNQLLKVSDLITNSPSGFKDGTNTGDDYEYDDYGNMIKDRNKGIITNITYNHLNLPVKIILENGQIEYLYNAAGVKLKKKVTGNLVSPSETTTDYLGGYQYRNNVLEFFPTAEGYVKHTVSGTEHNYNYVFNYTDHLGNVRLSYMVDPEDNVLKILEENHYYPFGLKHNGYNSSQSMIVGFPTRPPVKLTPVLNQSDVTYKYKYQGQELQDELGLNIYFFKYRMYDMAIGRFLQVDPLSEGYVYNSTYAFAENKVVANFELEGLEAKLAIYGDGATGTAYTTSDRISFEKRANGLGTKGYTTAKVSNGSQLISALKTATAAEGSIQKAVIYAHGGDRGVYLNNNDGFYGEAGDKVGSRAASVQDVSAGMKNGSIKFEDNASVVFASCNSCNGADITPVAESFTSETGVTSIGADGFVGPEIVNGKETGRLVTDGNFFKIDQVYDVKFQDGQGNILQSSTVTSQEQANGMQLTGEKAIHQKIITPRLEKTNLGNTIDPKSF